MKLLVLFAVLVNLKSVILFEQKVVPSCDQNEAICVFNWTIDYLETMVYFSEDQNPRPVVVRDGILQKRLGCNNYENITDTELARVITAEGSYKVLFAINGQVPGPSIVVYDGQQVVINLKNNLLTEGITIHWHGMVQRGTPWMDGVGTISHCPINAGESFTYRWIAEPVGTHWYHAHLGVERTDGLAGALIVLPKDSDKKWIRKTTYVFTAINLTVGQLDAIWIRKTTYVFTAINLTVGQLDAIKNSKAVPDFAEEYIMVLQDWKYSPSVEVNQEINWGLTGYLRDLNDPECYTTTLETDGGGVGLTAFESAVINGKGHYFINRTMEPDTPMLPYETFMVEEYKYYRFRIVHAGMMFAFRISFDKHAVQVISVDGNEVKEEGAESIIIHGGERADIVIFADQPIDNYWIRIETLESSTVAGEPIEPGKVLGVLRYQGAPTQLPTTEKMKCEADNRCKVINCPFKLFPDDYYTDCMAISDLKSTEETLKKQPVPTFESPDEFQEIFINFHFSTGANVPFTPSVNGHNFLTPSSPPQIYPTGDYFVDCKDKDCTDHCQCTHIIELQKDKVVQIVLLNMDDAPFSMPHPIHMHGHHFHVLKIGFPEYNSTTGEITKQNPDIRCTTEDCNSPTWANEDWHGGNIPDLNLIDPPLKDTIMVPGRGYIVLRIRADNPGYWFMHCHIEIHQIQGMAVLLKEGDPNDMSPTPTGFPTCGNFEFSEEEFNNIKSGKKKHTGKVQQPIPVVEEVIDETYVVQMAGEPRHKQHDNHPHHENPREERDRMHRFNNNDYVIISKTVLILLLITCIVLSVSLVICCCVVCCKRNKTTGLETKKKHFHDNLLQLQVSGKTLSKQNLLDNNA